METGRIGGLRIAKQRQELAEAHATILKRVVEASHVTWGAHLYTKLLVVLLRHRHLLRLLQVVVAAAVVVVAQRLSLLQRL